jgi:hypothetical protein
MLIAFSSINSDKSVSTYEDFDVLTADHKIIAVVPTVQGEET